MELSLATQFKPNLPQPRSWAFIEYMRDMAKYPAGRCFVLDGHVAFLRSLMMGPWPWTMDDWERQFGNFYCLIPSDRLL